MWENFKNPNTKPKKRYLNRSIFKICSKHYFLRIRITDHISFHRLCKSELSAVPCTMQPCRQVFWGTGKWKTVHWAGNVHLQPRKSTPSRAVSKGAWPARPGGWSCPSMLLLWVTGLLCPVLQFPVQERHELVRGSHANVQRTKTLLSEELLRELNRRAHWAGPYNDHPVHMADQVRVTKS